VSVLQEKFQNLIFFGQTHHQGEGYPLNPAFKDGDGNVMTLPKPRGNLDLEYQEGYR